MLAEPHSDKIYSHYNSPTIAASYGSKEYITPCERLLFDTYVSPGMAILDIGVGGGRTSPYLARNASRYVGIDYAPEMIRICRRKYPQWEYLEASATDLSPFQNGSFDLVVLSYNILDDLIPDEGRWRCLEECHRVLRENGLLIFSSHNPRAIFARSGQKNANGGQSKHAHVPNLVGRASALLQNIMRRSAIAFTTMCTFLRKALTYAIKPPFWRGEGYMLDCDNLMTHFCTPKKAVAELARFGFRFTALQGDDYPRKSHLMFTAWYYYVFEKLMQ